MGSQTPEQAARSALRHIASAKKNLATIESDDAVIKTSLELARATLAHATVVVESIAARVGKKEE